MRKVSIVGAGELGATAAAKLAAAGLVREVVLIGADAGQAEGKALDLVQSSALLESGCRVRAARDPGEMRDSSCVVVAGPGAGGVEDELPLELPALFETLGAVARDAVVAVAGDDPARALAAARATAKIPPERILGTGPAALASIWRLYLARALGCSPQDVAVSLVGAPPHEGRYETFASAGGIDVEELLSLAEQRRVAREVAATAPAGPKALASAAVAVLLDLARKEGAVHCCYVWAAEAYGARDVILCAPVVVGEQGVRRVLTVPLDPGRRVTVDRGIDFLSAVRR